jgi:hypothetical protein
MRAYEIFLEDVTDQIQPNQAVGSGPGKIAQTPGNKAAKPAMPSATTIANAAQGAGTTPDATQPVGQKQMMGQNVPGQQQTGSATQGTVGTMGTAGRPGTPDPKSGMTQTPAQQQSQLQKAQSQLQQKQQQDQIAQKKTDLTKDLNQLKTVAPSINVSKDADALTKPADERSPQDLKNMAGITNDIASIIGQQNGTQQLKQLLMKMKTLDAQKQQAQQADNQAELDSLSQQNTPTQAR